MAQKCLALHLYVDRRDDLKAKEVISMEDHYFCSLLFTCE